jgi:Uma2 family endonuclease
MNVRTAPRMDKEAFFAWIATQERRFELVDGVPCMQAHVTRRHMRIVMNVARLLITTLDIDRFNVATGDFAVETGPATIRFADVMVEPVGGSETGLSTRDALLLVEVLSPSTAGIDVGPKLREYRRLPRLGSYLICSQDETRVSIWTRQPDVAWPDEPLEISGSEGVVTVPVLDICMPLREIYRGVQA